MFALQSILQYPVGTEVTAMLGDRQATITDVARAANVSRTLVSFVLNGRKDVAPATRTRILKAIEELGYRPNTVARNLARKQAGAIGIVCPIESYQNPLDMQFLAAIMTKISSLERRVILIPADDRQIQEVAQDRAVDGMIFLDEHVADPRIAQVRTMGIQAVGIWGEHLASILREGIEELALHLESRGHQHVLYLYEPGGKLLLSQLQQVLSVILQDHSIALNLCPDPHDTEAEIANNLVQALKQSGATAIVASSDKLAISAIHRLHAARFRVPNDCAICGFGDVPAAQWVQPPLTTIRVPVQAMASSGVTKVFNEKASDDSQFLQDLAGCRLIVRRSC